MKYLSSERIMVVTLLSLSIGVANLCVPTLVNGASSATMKLETPPKNSDVCMIEVKSAHRKTFRPISKAWKIDLPEAWNTKLTEAYQYSDGTIYQSYDVIIPTGSITNTTSQERPSGLRLEVRYRGNKSLHRLYAEVFKSVRPAHKTLADGRTLFSWTEDGNFRYSLVNAGHWSLLFERDGCWIPPAVLIKVMSSFHYST